LEDGTVAASLALNQRPIGQLFQVQSRTQQHSEIIFLFALGEGDFVGERFRIGGENDAPFDDQVDDGAAIAQDLHGRAVVDVLQRVAVDAHHPVVYR